MPKGVDRVIQIQQTWHQTKLIGFLVYVEMYFEPNFQYSKQYSNTAN